MHNRFHQNNPRSRFWIAFILVIFLLIFLRQCVNHSKSHDEPKITVVTAPVERGNVPVYLSALGTVTPISTVTVRSQVNGQLLRVLYHEGQMVKAGELIAEIDPRPFQAQLTQYEGQLARDKALLANAKIDLQRFKTLWKEDSTSKQTLDTQISLVKQYEGSIKADEGLIQSTKVNLIYTQVIAPINGRIGLRLVDPGNYVQVGDTSGLAVITSLDPITVQFSLPQNDIPQILQQMKTGKTLTTIAYDSNEEMTLGRGSLITVDNQIDPTTGTVKLRALFRNPHNQFFPNQFVNIKLLIKTLDNALIIPTSAVQYGPDNTFVYVLNEDNTVSVKPITVELSKDDITVVAKGLKLGQMVVVEGVDKLTDGVKVSVDAPLLEEKTTQKIKHKHHA